jgi:hypothetical protein
MCLTRESGRDAGMNICQWQSAGAVFKKILESKKNSLKIIASQL